MTTARRASQENQSVVLMNFTGHQESQKPETIESNLSTIQSLNDQVTQLTMMVETLKEEKKIHTSIFIKANNQLINLSLKDILYVEALGDYVNFFTEKERFIVHKTMKGIEEKLPLSQFKRVHRSFIVRLDKIHSIEESLITIGKKLIPVGEVYRPELMNTINLL